MLEHVWQLTMKSEYPVFRVSRETKEKGCNILYDDTRTRFKYDYMAKGVSPVTYSTHIRNANNNNNNNSSSSGGGGV